MNELRQVSVAAAQRIQTPAGVQTLTVIALVVVWEMIGRTGLLFAELFPSVTGILGSLWVYVSTPVLIPHLKASLYEVGGGLLLGALCGIPLGVIFGSRRSFMEVMEPIILYLAVVPKIIIFPIFILFLGIGTGSKLAVGALAAFFPIVLLTIAGMREVRPVYLDVATTLGAGPWQLATKVYLPAITGYVFTGMRIGMGASVTGALLAETKIAKAGLGFMIVEYYSQFRMADMYSLLLFIFILAAAANWAMKRVFSLLLPLPRSTEDAGVFF
ncbi:MAG: hypothetical protein A2038_07545 [Deltaproteobacteria bacterium GWA2_57_13]|nr:MAG: hypothetical protein A2038_07545 [Deltaproteobacteria bacterium GWA2_57_13]